jgi:hypothetical protein
VFSIMSRPRVASRGSGSASVPQYADITTGKPTALAAATASSAPKKSLDATPALATTDTSATEEPVVAAPAAARVGSSSSSSSDEAKKAKKSKSRSASRGNKRTSIFGGLLGKKDKPEEKTDAKKLEHKEGSDAVVTADEPEIKKDDAPAVASVTDVAPVIESTYISLQIPSGLSHSSIPCQRLLNLAQSTWSERLLTDLSSRYSAYLHWGGHQNRRHPSTGCCSRC